MSGAAALASARRRRAAPQAPQIPQQPQQVNVPPPVPNNSPLENIGVKTNVKQTPTQMLLSHNKMISNLQEVISTLNEVVDKNVLSKDEMKEFIEKIIKETIDKQNLNESNLSFFKEKYKRVESQLNEMKKHVLKIQSFSMDTNLQCIELRKKMNREKNYKNIDQFKNEHNEQQDISNETRQEHLKMLKNNTALNNILETNE